MMRKLRYDWASTPAVSPALLPPSLNDDKVIFPSYNGLVHRVFSRLKDESDSHPLVVRRPGIYPSTLASSAFGVI